MRVSVVIRTRNEAARLRLTLASLRRQEALDEVVVIDDGSSDHTPDVLSEAARALPLATSRHAHAKGRSAAANAGAVLANGELLIFLDGDMPVREGFVEAHRAAHARAGSAACMIARGETWHLRCTRFLQDPHAGIPFAEHAQRLVRQSSVERDAQRVTLAQIEGDFATIDRRAQPAIYPGAGPRWLYELEMDALTRYPDCSVLWAAASGSNQSVRRDVFLDVGGFHTGIDLNEHRELALRLTRRGARMCAAPHARSYHQTHRSGWRDPLHEGGWEALFWEAHPSPEVALLPVFWASLADRSPLAPEQRIDALPALAARAAVVRGIRAESAAACRRALGYPEKLT
jgi:glycosyltransferase involved in cell wall biosynthesis